MHDVSKASNYAWVKDLFKVKVRPIDLNGTEFKSSLVHFWIPSYNI